MKRRLFVKPHEGVKCEQDNEQVDGKGTRAVVARLGCAHCRDTDIHRIARKPIQPLKDQNARRIDWRRGSESLGGKISGTPEINRRSAKKERD